MPPQQRGNPAVQSNTGLPLTRRISRYYGLAELGKTTALWLKSQAQNAQQIEDHPFRAMLVGCSKH